ncbi:MAG: hypothetical protein H0U59_00500 [Gemmatimonadaceae bacterium]|nr:hypothetical protein [Gemmatimonadaceae bacterium]
MIRMHPYPNGTTGLAAFCDICHNQIREHGYIVWNGDNVTDWLVIHQAKCDPGRPRYDMSMPLDVELLYLANSAGINLKDASKSLRVFDMIG